MEQLKQPELVAQIQKYFGVIPLPKEENKHTPNGTNYLIKNKFWYYLFKFGTALGDELFYTAFIPFWFWNIDGAVGRRVVMVWTIVMYIGMFFKFF